MGIIGFRGNRNNNAVLYENITFSKTSVHKNGAAGVINFNVVLFHTIHRHPLDARKPAHAVVDVDHQVAGGRVAKVLEA